MSVTLYNTHEGAQDMGEVTAVMRKAMSDIYRWMTIVTGNWARLPGVRERVTWLIWSRLKTEKIFF